AGASADCGRSGVATGVVPAAAALNRALWRSGGPTVHALVPYRSAVTPRGYRRAGFPDRRGQSVADESAHPESGLPGVRPRRCASVRAADVVASWNRLAQPLRSLNRQAGAGRRSVSTCPGPGRQKPSVTIETVAPLVPALAEQQQYLVVIGILGRRLAMQTRTLCCMGRSG